MPMVLIRLLWVFGWFKIEFEPNFDVFTNV